MLQRTSDYPDNALRNRGIVTSAVSSISPRTAASIVIRGERSRSERERKEVEEEGTMVRPTRSRYEGMRVFISHR